MLQVRRRLQKLRMRFHVPKRYRRYEFALLGLAVAYLIAYQLKIMQLPPYVRNEVIVTVATALLTVEGVLIALSPQIRTPSVRNFVAVGLGVPAILVSVITIVQASFQSVQLEWLSTSETTTLFRIDSILFALFVELYAIGILFIPSRKKSENGEL